MTQIAMWEDPDSNLGRHIRDPERLCGFPQIRQARAVIVLSLDHDPFSSKSCKTLYTAINTMLWCSGSVVS